MTNAQTVGDSTPARLDAAAVHQHWVQTANVVGQRILALHKLSLAVREAAEKSFLSECVASLEDVSDALHALHVAVIDPRVRPWLSPDSPLSAYLSASYNWCANVLASLRELLELGEGSLWHVGERALSRRSSEYIQDRLDPLFHRLDELCEPVRSAEHPLNWIWSRAEQVESAIACLDWELKAEEVEEEDEEMS